MASIEFNVRTELRKFMRGRKTRVSAETLLGCIVGEYLRLSSDAERNGDGNRDSTKWLEDLFSLKDPRA
jgi:hypothetical protein